MTRGSTPSHITRPLLGLDAVALSFAAIGILLLLFGSLRTSMGEATVNVGSQHAFFFAGAVAAVRHAWQSSPSIVTSLQH